MFLDTYDIIALVGGRGGGLERFVPRTTDISDNEMSSMG